MTEAKRPIKAQLEAELAAAASDDEMKSIRAAFSQREAAIENEIGKQARVQCTPTARSPSNLPNIPLCLRRPQADGDAPDEHARHRDWPYLLFRH